MYTVCLIGNEQLLKKRHKNKTYKICFLSWNIIRKHVIYTDQIIKFLDIWNAVFMIFIIQAQCNLVAISVIIYNNN